MSRFISEQYEPLEIVETKETASQCVMEGIINSLFDTESQSSQQKRKQLTREKAQVHRQKMEHEHWLTQQRRRNERFSAKAQ
ncbi:hypothetical protein O181_058787 [Austropuccinia psidii MF-1]|uniref:Uncharacterized protein n=1 Tax=Austropuccinia psidii MF-1 TaxID=1389203 RepID=A0A9Q3HWS7_9BASI|nr:hypothetical protein [Austropuccinia psidii MF-1]